VTLYQILQHLLETSQKHFVNSNISSSSIATALNIYVWSGSADKSLFLLASIWHMGQVNSGQRNKANPDFEVEGKHMDTNLISIFAVQVKQKSYCSKNTSTKQLFCTFKFFNKHPRKSVMGINCWQTRSKRTWSVAVVDSLLRNILVW